MIATKNDILEDWVHLFSDDLFRWAMYKTSDRETAEDLVQETFLAACNGFDNFHGKSKPKTWLFSIINHKITDFYRRQFRCPVINQSHLDDISTHYDVLENFFDSAGSWKVKARPSEWQEIEEHLLDNSEFTGILNSCIKNLSKTSLLVMNLKYLKEKDGKEICQELRISPTNYWQIIHRAKIKLRHCLEQNWFKS